MDIKNPQKFDFKKLSSLSLNKREQLPTITAIYFVIRYNKIIYIGRAFNLKNRWKIHHKLKELEKLRGIKIAWVQVTDKSLLIEIEKALINWFKPSLNIQKNYANKFTTTKIKTRIQKPNRRRVKIN